MEGRVVPIRAVAQLVSLVLWQAVYWAEERRQTIPSKTTLANKVSNSREVGSWVVSAGCLAEVVAMVALQ